MNFSRPSTHSQTTAQEYPPTQPIYITSGGTAVVVIAMLLLTIIILYITSRNSMSAPYGILGSVAFFLVGTPLSLLAVNGGMAEMWRSWQEQKSIRLRDRLDTQLQIAYQQPTVQIVPPQQIEYKPDTDPLQSHSGRRFVSAVPKISDAAKVDAANFITQLFDTGTGRPLPNKITRNKGQIQHTSPTSEAKEYLMSLGIVSAPEGKQLYWSPHYPTLQEAINAVRTGRKPSYKEGKIKGEEGIDEQRL